MTAARAAIPVSELTAALMRKHAESRFTPPLMDWHSPLSDVMIHREDIAVPLGLASDRPVESWRHVLDFVVSPKARRGFGVRRLPRRATGRHGRGLVPRRRSRRWPVPAAPLAWAISGGAAGLGGAQRAGSAIFGPPPRSVEPRTLEEQLKKG